MLLAAQQLSGMYPIVLQHVRNLKGLLASAAAAREHVESTAALALSRSTIAAAQMFNFCFGGVEGFFATSIKTSTNK